MSTSGQPQPTGPVHDRHPAPVDERRRETGMGHANPSMWLGAVRRAALWGAIGAAMGLALGLIPWADVPLALRLAAFGIGGLLGGAAAGFVYGAGRQRDLDEEARRETAFAPMEHPQAHRVPER